MILQLDVFFSTTTEEVKKMIEDKEYIPFNQQSLIFDGHYLDNSCKLADYDIKQDSTIHLMLKLSGGGAGFSIEATDLLTGTKTIFG